MSILITPADISAFAGRNRLLRPFLGPAKRMLLRRDLVMLFRLAGRRCSALPLGTASAQLTGTTIRQNLTHARTQFETLSRAIKYFKPDGIGILADLTIEAEACGCGIAYPEFGLPYVINHPVQTMEDVEALEVPDPFRTARMPVVMDTLRLLSQRFGLPIGAGGIGPFTLAGELIGTQRLALATIKETEFAHALLEFANRVVIEYNRGQLASGADTLIIAEPAGSILSAPAFREFSGDYLERMLRELDAPVTVHVCGDSTHLIDELVRTRPAGLSFDAPVDMPDAARTIPGSIMLSGNLDPIDVLLEMSPPELRTATMDLLESMKPYPNFILASGCDIAPETPLDNIKCIIETVRQYRARRSS